MGASAICAPLIFVGLSQTNYVSPMFYTIPGIPPDSIFYYPLNIFGQILLYCVIVESIVSMDCLFIIYLFYFRGELYAINSVAENLHDKEILDRQCYRILMIVHKAHINVLNKFEVISNVIWHFYFQKFFVLSLYLCVSFFFFMKVSNTGLVGVVLFSFILSQLVLLCVPGQLIVESSETLCKTLYMILWQDMKLDDQRNILMLLIGAQRTIQLETFAIGQISIYTYVQVRKLIDM